MNALMSTEETPETTSTLPTIQPDRQSRQRLIIVGSILAVVLLLAFVAGATIYLYQPSTQTEKIRDIFIIFMALEFLLVGLALVVLIAQLASLINLLQNEVKPILESTNQTANTLRGTALFLSDNLVDPVIKLSGYMAALQRLIGLLNIGRK